MSLNQIGGQIKSQPLNDNFSYLDGKVDDIAGAGRTTETVKGNADAIAAHLAETATDDVHGLLGKIIEESGSNANGRYVRFADGTQVCYLENFTLTFGGQHFLQYTWPFPAGFINKPSVTWGCGVKDGKRDKVILIISNVTTTSCLFLIAGNSTDAIFSSENTGLGEGAVAVGRWK